MKENYLPWSVKVEDFPENRSLYDQIKFLLGFAILAPSGHNSQPWEFSIKNNSVEFWVNQERSLDKSDPERRQLLIAIGCSLENLVTAADYYGFSYDIHYLPNSSDKNLIAQVIFKKIDNIKNSHRHLIFRIPHRRTNRNKYKNQSPPLYFLDEIKNFSDQDFKVTIITEKKIKEAVADIVNTAQIEAMEQDFFREELSRYIKSNFTKSKVGMPGFTLGMSTPVSLIASRLIKKINMSKRTTKKDDALLKKFTSAFVVVSTGKDDELNRIKIGQLLEKIWLMAEREGLACAPLAAGVQVGEYYKELQKVLGLIFRPIVFFRLGYCDKIPHHSPRLDINDVLIR